MFTYNVCGVMVHVKANDAIKITTRDVSWPRKTMIIIL